MRPTASLSLDLDDQWTYLRIHGDPGWRQWPSYLEFFVARLLDFLAERDLKITIFVVGKDAERPQNHRLLSALAAAGHEIGNHSHRHEPWLHLYSREEIATEIELAHKAIEEATGERPRGFRGPGYSLSYETLGALTALGYRYDASTLPTFLGPLSRAFYFRSTRLSAEQRHRRARLFGKLNDGLRPLRPYRWRLGEGGALIEVPVTTMPLFRTPIHFTYLHYLQAVAPRLGVYYFELALWLCRLRAVPPSIVLHPLDFLGCDDTEALSFFPAMQRESRWKLDQASRYLAILTEKFNVVPIGRQLDLMASEKLSGCTRRPL
ncbi:MAG: polysaccharide deacetylase family protein [bacterium]|nr:polysaccharide deacetylase family protein [bacterium]